MLRINMRKCLSIAIKTATFIPVLLIVALLIWVYSAYVFVFFSGFYPIYPGLCLLFLAIFHGLYILLSYTYYKVVFTHPGRPPPRQYSSTVDGIRSADSTDIPIDIVVDNAENTSTTTNNHPSNIIGDNINEGGVGADYSSTVITDNSSLLRLYNSSAEAGDYSFEQWSMLTSKRNGQPRICRKCQNYKPDRTHHCSICGECILKFDHHCPWVNNCVGFYNQKYFVLFTLYGSLMGLFVFLSVISLASSGNGIFSGGEVGGSGSTLQIVFLAIIGVVFSIALAAFTSIHFGFIMYNKTTVETWVYLAILADSNRRYPRGSNNNNNDYINIFDLGKYENWCQVMGPNKWLWFLPVGNSIGNGVEFCVRQDQTF